MDDEAVGRMRAKKTAFEARLAGVQAELERLSAMALRLEGAIAGLDEVLGEVGGEVLPEASPPDPLSTTVERDRG